MHPVRPVLAAAAAAAVLLLSACSSPTTAARPSDAGDAGVVESTAPTPTPTTPPRIDIASLDACTLLTAADAESLIGTTLTDPMRAATSDVSSCTYPGDPNGPTAQVEVYVGPGAKKQLDTDKDTLQHAFTAVSGVGDEAWQEEGMIFARTGTTWASVRVVTLDDPAGFVTPLQTAMTTVLGRL